MTPQEYRRLAEESEQKATQAADPAVKYTYEELARRWRALADEVERHGLARGTFGD
jgi:acyl-CoA synthetase (AMP-forming)/AMP-acid ligase II